MRFNIILRYIGMVLLFNAGFMLISALVSIFNDWDTGTYPLLLSFLLTFFLGIFPMIFVEPSKSITTKESYMVVVGSWVLSCLAGMIPYLLWGGEFSLINSWFESVSGFTTTGSTILQDVEALPKGLLFWRSATHWIGGVGVVMFAMIVLPSLGMSKKSMYNVELSTMAKDHYQYRKKKILQILLVVYLGLTLSLILFLKLAGLDWFESVNNAFSTIATGGFSTKNASIAAYNNVSVEIILIVYMILSGLHFGLIFAAVAGKNKNLFKLDVPRYYFLSILIGIACVVISVWSSGLYPDFWNSLRYGAFQVISMVTTTGLATADMNLWTPFAMAIIIFLSVQCACAGSTSGGLKADRVLLFFKAVRAALKKQRHPNAIVRVKLNGVLQDPKTVDSEMLFIAFYIFIFVAGGILLTMFGLDMTTSFTASIASIGNVGPGFGMVGSMNNYADLPVMGKIITTFLMLLGRLEIYGLLHIFAMRLWK